MRFMMMVKATKNSEAGLLPPSELLAAMAKLTEEMDKAGVLLAAGGLQPSSRGSRVKYSGGTRTVTDGPFTEAKELIAGFSLVQAKSKEEAIELANRFGDLHIQAGIAEFEVEIRPLFEPAEFGAAKK
jgi:hypothetical protein